MFRKEFNDDDALHCVGNHANNRYILFIIFTDILRNTMLDKSQHFWRLLMQFLNEFANWMNVRVIQINGMYFGVTRTCTKHIHVLFVWRWIIEITNNTPYLECASIAKAFTKRAVFDCGLPILTRFKMNWQSINIYKITTWSPRIDSQSPHSHKFYCVRPR